MINYTEKGIGLHEEIARQGYKLFQLDGVWVADDEVAVQEIIDSYEPVAIFEANWDMFNAMMLSDSEFNQVYNTANSIAPVICASLPAALTQVSTGQLSMFAVIWSQIMQLGNATPEMKVKWSNWASNNNLPVKFVDIISG